MSRTWRVRLAASRRLVSRSTQRRSIPATRRRTTSFRDLALMVADVVEGAEVTFAEGAGTDPRSYKVDFSKIRSVLPGFACGWDARRGAEALAAAYRAASMDDDLFTGDMFTVSRASGSLLAADQLDTDLRWREPSMAQGAA